MCLHATSEIIEEHDKSMQYLVSALVLEEIVEQVVSDLEEATSVPNNTETC